VTKLPNRLMNEPGNKTRRGVGAFGYHATGSGVERPHLFIGRRLPDAREHVVVTVAGLAELLSRLFSSLRRRAEQRALY
jgi:hypothetical protein